MIAGNKDTLPQLDRLLEFEIAGAKALSRDTFSVAIWTLYVRLG